jgi:hypothetical protein
LFGFPSSWLSHFSSVLGRVHITCVHISKPILQRTALWEWRTARTRLRAEEFFPPRRDASFSSFGFVQDARRLSASWELEVGLRVLAPSPAIGPQRETHRRVRVDSEEPPLPLSLHFHCMCAEELRAFPAHAAIRVFRNASSHLIEDVEDLCLRCQQAKSRRLPIVRRLPSQRVPELWRQLAGAGMHCPSGCSQEPT